MTEDFKRVCFHHRRVIFQLLIVSSIVCLLVKSWTNKTDMLLAIEMKSTLATIQSSQHSIGLEPEGLQNNTEGKKNYFKKKIALFLYVVQI